jgi:hypothetical protein
MGSGFFGVFSSDGLGLSSEQETIQEVAIMSAGVEKRNSDLSITDVYLKDKLDKCFCLQPVCFFA